MSSARLLFPLLFLLGGVSAINAEPFHGQSVDLGFVFTARNADQWCQDVVQIDLGVGDRAKFDRNPYGLEKRLNRLLKWTQSACPSVRRLEVRGWSGQEMIYNVEYARSTNWLFIRKNTNTNIPQCPPGTAPALCEPLVHGFAFFEHLTDGRNFENIVLTDFLEGRRSNIEWRDGQVKGSLNSFDPSDFSEASGLIAGAVSAALEQDCTNSSGRIVEQPQLPAKSNAAYAGFNCVSSSGVTATNIIVVKYSDYGWIFSIGSNSNDTTSARLWAENIYSKL